MIKRNESDWQEIVTDWQRGGLSLNEYCRQKNLSPSSFHKWSRKLGGKKTQENPSPLAGFVEVVTHAEPAVARLILTITTTSGCKIEVPL